jgi:hypothetical protein
MRRSPFVPGAVRTLSRNNKDRAMNRLFPLAAGCTAALAFASSSAWAGRPLGVDNAGINDKGSGHVEAWAAREPGKTDTVYVAPAYSPWQMVELSGLFSRNRTNSVNSGGLQVRALVTEPRPAGCNLLVSIGHSRFNPGSNQSFAYTAATCNRGVFALHANLGAVKPSGASSNATWGIALEHDTGTFFPHIEMFGQEGSKPTFQVGARRDVTKIWQVDGSLGRFNGETIFSLGFKFSF